MDPRTGSAEREQPGAQRGCEPDDRRCALLVLGPCREVDRAAEQQALPGASHGDVEDAVLLFAFAPALLGTELLEVEHLDRLSLAGAAQLQPDARTIDEQPVRWVRRAAPEIGHTDDRELEPLGGMDGHQAHRVRLDTLDGRLRLLGGGAFEMLDVIDEAAEVPPFLSFEGACHAQQLVDVGQPSLGPVEGQYAPGIAAAVDRPLEQLGDAAAGGAGPLGRKPGAEASQHGVVVRRELAAPSAAASSSASQTVLPCPRCRSAISARPSREQPTRGEARVE